MENKNKIGFYSKPYEDESKIDAIVLDLENKEHIIFEDIKAKEVAKELEKHVPCCTYIEVFGMDKLKELARGGEFDEIIRILADNEEYFEWEEFYTESPEDDEKIDFIAINSIHRCYALELNTNEDEADGYTELGMEACATYVSREIFDSIVEGIKKKGYKRFEKEK